MIQQNPFTIALKLLPTLLLILASWTTEINGQESAIEPEYTLLKGPAIIDGVANDAKIGNVLIKDDQIHSIDYDGQDVVPDGTVVYDLNGHFIIPGLIDAHVHLATDPSGKDNIESTKIKLEYLLKNGVTAVRDMAGDTRSLAFLSRQATLDEIPSPDIYYSALMAGRSFFDDPRTHSSGRGVIPGDCAWMRAVDLENNMPIAVAEAKGTGATGIKIYADLEADVIKNIVSEAHRQKMKVWAHAAVFPAKPQSIVDAGVDVVSHATLLAWEGVDYLPSSAKERYITQDNFNISNPSFSKMINTMQKQGTILDATIAVYHDDRFDSTIFKQGVDLTRMAFQNGVKIAVGTDNLNLSELPNTPPILTEMQLLRDHVGMSEMDIIKSATIINAMALGIDHQTGSIQVGKKANLLILREDPLEDISNIQSIRFVMKNGKVTH